MFVYGEAELEMLNNLPIITQPVSAIAEIQVQVYGL